MHATATDNTPPRRCGRIQLVAVVGMVIGSIAGCSEPVPVAALEQASPELDVSAAYETAMVKEARSGDGYAADDYELFDLGPAQPGDTWRVSISADAGRFVVVILDDDYNLLQRAKLVPGQTVTHVFRHEAKHVSVGVQPLDGIQTFELEAAAWSGHVAPEPRTQIVWLSFEGADGVSIQNGPALSFGAFDAATLNAAYAGQTQVIKDTIVQTVRDQYAGYNVVVLSSDEQPEPVEAHSTVYFGSGSDGLLGLADGVDRYNQDANDNAIVFVSAFAAYTTMNLAEDEMGHMIGNIASHELGHLLGLFHTRSEQYHLMDDAASAWDMTGAASLTRASLADTVFPVGMEDVPLYLAETIGTN
ncbi:MAG: hypothetical protein JXO22_07520 [Phycisphaerae bacterium]|nr:hypothetical protein [Phycisphaerae bacterium]